MYPLIDLQADYICDWDNGCSTHYKYRMEVLLVKICTNLQLDTLYLDVKLLLMLKFLSQ